MPTSVLKYTLFWLVVLCGCLGNAKGAESVLLQRAVFCLDVKGFLPHSDATKQEFGYFLDEKSYPKEKVLYVVNYLHSKEPNGLVFTIFLRGPNSNPTFNIQNNARFSLVTNSDESVSFVTPPLGGIWVQKHIVSSIEQIEKQSRIAIAVKNLLLIHPLVHCEAYTDPQPDLPPK